MQASDGVLSTLATCKRDESTPYKQLIMLQELDNKLTKPHACSMKKSKQLYFLHGTQF